MLCQLVWASSEGWWWLVTHSKPALKLLFFYDVYVTQVNVSQWNLCDCLGLTRQYFIRVPSTLSWFSFRKYSALETRRYFPHFFEFLQSSIYLIKHPWCAYHEHPLHPGVFVKQARLMCFRLFSKNSYFFSLKTPWICLLKFLLKQAALLLLLIYSVTSYLLT